MVNTGTVKIAKSVMVSVSRNGYKYADSYLFIKKLSSHFKHPIILNFKSTLPDLSKKTGLSAYVLRSGLKKAISFGLATVEGNHIRLCSIKFERKTMLSRKDKHKVLKADDLLRCYQVSVLDAERVNQLSGKRFKNWNQGTHRRSMPFGDSNAQNKPMPHVNDKCNDAIMSARLASKLFGYKSPLAGQSILNELTEAGLINLQANTTVLTTHEFLMYKTMPQFAYHLRYDKESNQFLYVKAKNFARTDKFWLNPAYLGESIVVEKKERGGYCSSDLFLDNF